MKPIRILDGPTPGLARYLTHTGVAATWRGFRRRNPERSLELVDALTRLQHGLCGYCEIDLQEDDRQIEHVIPQSHPNEGAARDLDPANLLACCRGGELTHLSADEERFWPPRQENVSCGQAKGGVTDIDFIDPRTLPSQPSLMRVSYDGRIEADRDACNEAGFSVESVTKTIEILQLNVERLRRAREKRWIALEANWQEHQDDSELMQAAACAELLPQADGSLAKFFTTNRSFFARWSESILEQQPRGWI